MREPDDRGVLKHHDHAIGIVIRERSKHNRIEGGKNGGIGSDAERQGDDRNGGEGGRLAEEAEPVLKVGEECSHLMSLPDWGRKVTRFEWRPTDRWSPRVSQGRNAASAVTIARTTTARAERHHIQRAHVEQY